MIFRKDIMNFRKNKNALKQIQSNSFGAASDVGIVRNENQDAVFIGTNVYNNLVVIVCDGLGGYKGGAIASTIVCGLFRDEFLATDFNGKSRKFIEDWFGQIVLKSRHHINNYILNNSYHQTDLSQMATTIVFSLIANKKIYTFWIGDSRAYLVDINKQAWQITLDHNLYNALKKVNATEATFKKHSNELLALTNIISKEINPDQTFDVSIHDLNTHEKYLILCSDGFYNFVNSEHFYKLIEENNNDMVLASKNLINIAMKNLSNDNVTVAIVNLTEVLHAK